MDACQQNECRQQIAHADLVIEELVSRVEELESRLTDGSERWTSERSRRHVMPS